MPDEDRDRFVHEARKEGVSLSEWLRTAARERVDRQQQRARFETLEDVSVFFGRCDETRDSGAEPDWEQHLTVINASRRRGTSAT